MGIVFDAVRKADDGGDIKAKYSRKLARLTAALAITDEMGRWA